CALYKEELVLWLVRLDALEKIAPVVAAALLARKFWTLLRNCSPHRALPIPPLIRLLRQWEYARLRCITISPRKRKSFSRCSSQLLSPPLSWQMSLLRSEEHTSELQ